MKCKIRAKDRHKYLLYWLVFWKTVQFISCGGEKQSEFCFSGMCNVQFQQSIVQQSYFCCCVYYLIENNFNTQQMKEQSSDLATGAGVCTAGALFCIYTDWSSWCNSGLRFSPPFLCSCVYKIGKAEAWLHAKLIQLNMYKSYYFSKAKKHFAQNVRKLSKFPLKLGNFLRLWLCLFWEAKAEAWCDCAEYRTQLHTSKCSHDQPRSIDIRLFLASGLRYIQKSYPGNNAGR